LGWKAVSVKIKGLDLISSCKCRAAGIASGIPCYSSKNSLLAGNLADAFVREGSRRYSGHNIIVPLAEAGFHVVAPDQRRSPPASGRLASGNAPGAL
jgi:hypothetical protein